MKSQMKEAFMWSAPVIVPLLVLAFWASALSAGTIDEKASVADLAVQQSQGFISFGDFLLGLPTSKDAQIFYAILAGNLIGAFGNIFWRWQKADGDAGLWDYYKAQGKKRAWFVIGSIITWSAGEVGSGIFVTTSGIFIGWSLVMISGIKTGFMGASFSTKKEDPNAPVTIAPLPVSKAP